MPFYFWKGQMTQYKWQNKIFKIYNPYMNHIDFWHLIFHNMKLPHIEKCYEHFSSPIQCDILTHYHPNILRHWLLSLVVPKSQHYLLINLGTSYFVLMLFHIMNKDIMGRIYFPWPTGMPFSIWVSFYNPESYTT